MGLDMYLRAEKYVSGYDFRGAEEVALYSRIVGAAGLSAVADPNTPGVTVQVTVAYWRKANQIHNWFVQNVQDGKDECQEAYVNYDQLRELYDACIKVLSTLALPAVERGTDVVVRSQSTPTLTPEKVQAVAQEAGLETAAGFFFGSTDYDEWFIRDIRDTADQLERIFAIYPPLPEGEYRDVSFSYQSSW